VSCKRADESALNGRSGKTGYRDWGNALDERRLGVTPREPDVDDKRNPAVVQDRLLCTLLSAAMASTRKKTHPADLDDFYDTFLGQVRRKCRF
jgi:hypothetical protein